MAARTFRKTQNLPVIAMAEGAIVGKFDDFQFDLETGRIYGYRVRGQGVWARAGGVAAGELLRYGRDVVFIREEAAVRWSGVSRAPEPGRAWATAYRGVSVVSRKGEPLGSVQDFMLDVDPPRVRALVLDRHRLLAVGASVVLGRDAVVVPDPAVVLGSVDEEEITDTWARGELSGEGGPSEASGSGSGTSDGAGSTPAGRGRTGP